MSDNSETRFLNDLRARQTPEYGPKNKVRVPFDEKLYEADFKADLSRPKLFHLHPKQADYYGYWAMFALGMMVGATCVLLAGCGGDDRLSRLKPGTPPSEAEQQIAWQEGRACIENRYRVDTGSAVQPVTVFNQGVRCSTEEARVCCAPGCRNGQACVRDDQAVEIALTSDPFCEPMGSKLRATLAASAAFQSGVPRDENFDIFLACGGID